MVNFDHEAILSRGVEAWNKWRQEFPDITPDLENSHLSVLGGAISSHLIDPELPLTVDLPGINFSNTILRGTFLGWADLRDASFVGADLTKADFTNANLICAKFKEANLHRAKLANSLLVSADFSDAELKGTDFSNAVFRVEDLKQVPDLVRRRYYSGYPIGYRMLKLVHPRLSLDHPICFSRSNLGFSKIGSVSLQKARLEAVEFSGANLQGMNFRSAILRRANFNGANLSSADLRGADLRWADLKGAILDNADLEGANICGTDFTAASLERANLARTIAIETKFRRTKLSGAYIYGIAAWSVDIEDAKQQDLVITKSGEPEITVDQLEVAQFIYLLLQNDRIRDVIDTIGKKAVLILGRFTSHRKKVLDAIRSELRNRGFLPIMFDFDKPSSRDTVETVSILAHISRFVIADLTDAKSVLQELQRIVPGLPSVPVQPLLAQSDCEPGMFDHLGQFRSVLPIHRYESIVDLLESLDVSVIGPAQAVYEQKHRKDL